MISFSKTEKSINKIIRDGKRFMAYDIIKRLKEKELKHILEKFEKAVSGTDNLYQKFRNFYSMPVRLALAGRALNPPREIL